MTAVSVIIVFVTTQNEIQQQPSTARHHICLPFPSEEHYNQCINDTKALRLFLHRQFHLHPEIFPASFAHGYEFHSQYTVKKQDLVIRRIKLLATGQLFSLRPSFLMPYAIARTDDLEKALYLRQFGVPFTALAYVFGRDANFWERAWLSFGRTSIVGTTVKAAAKVPRHLVADEKITWLESEEVLVATTSGGGCFLGIGLAKGETAEQLQKAYGEFKDEVRHIDEAYSPETVCTDGFKSTRRAWQRLFPQVVLILCFLHGVLKIRQRCRGELRRKVLDRVWKCYQAETVRQFSQRLRRLSEWASKELSGFAQEMVIKLEQQREKYKPAYLHIMAHRTTNAIDRLMDKQDRLLYAMRYLHGKDETARLALRAMALQWNFHPYGERLKRMDHQRESPFADLNGFQYHKNWLHNLLIASSLGGLRL
jgi:hypothetical protein